MPSFSSSNFTQTNISTTNSTLLPIAALCTFTSTGKINLFKYKYQDSDNVLQENKKYAGTRIIWFSVEATVNECKYEQTILYYTETSLWKLKIK